MIRPALRVSLRLLAAAVAALAIVAVALAWRLSQGPVSLSFLTPAMETILNAGHDTARFEIGEVRVSWDEASGTLGVDLQDTQVTSPDGRELAAVPEMAVVLDAGALVRGDVSPRRITVNNPRLRLPHRDDRILDQWIDELVSAPGGATGDGGMADLEALTITNADLRIEDAAGAAVWSGAIPEAKIWPTDDGPAGALTLNGEDGAEMLTVSGRYDRAGHDLQIDAALRGLRLPDFAGISRRGAALEAVDAPLTGTASLSIVAGGAIATIRFDLSVGPGFLVLTEPLAAEFGASGWAQRLPIAGGRLAGAYEGASGNLDIDTLRVDAGDGAHVAMPAPLDHALPLRSVAFDGGYHFWSNQLDVRALEFDLGGPQATISADLSFAEPGPSGTISGTVEDVPVNDLSTYWPRAVAPNPYKWVMAHLSEGVAEQAQFRLELGADSAGASQVSGLTGSMTISGVTVDYLPPLPPVHDAAAIASFDMTRFSFAIEGGEAAGVAVDGGTVVFFDLDGNKEKADIELKMTGGLGDVLRLIDHEPLGYASEVGIDPGAASGTTAVTLSLRFPLLKDLSFDDVEITARADIEDLLLKDAILDHDIDGGRLSLSIDKERMDVEGRLRVNGIEGSVDARENFQAGDPFRRRIAVAAPQVPLSRLQSTLFKKTVIPSAIADGAVAAEGTFVQFDDRSGEFTLDLGLSEARIAIPMLGWEKAVGEPAKITLDGRIGRDESVTIPRVEVTGRDLNASGAADFDPGFHLKQLVVQRIATGRTDVEATLVMQPRDRMIIDVRGSSLDLAALWAEPKTPLPEAAGSGSGQPDLVVHVNLGRLWLAPDRQFSSVIADAERDGDLWVKGRVQGRVDGGASVTATLERQAPQRRAVAVHADDAGAALAALGLFSGMEGGRLTMAGTFADDQPSRPLSGVARVSDYRILDAPLIARILSGVALTGLSDALSGDSLTFSTLVVPFTLDDGTLTMTDARATGLSIGFTADGRIDLDQDRVDVTGTVVPIYSINAALGRIPLVGNLLTGGEKGGGVFAATYTVTGPLDDPDVSVNPLSALAPSYLRRLFGFLDGPSGADVPPQPRRRDGSP